ncbi:hypothetical protein Ocin01_06381, partial [Orchesella cincta]
IFNIIIFVLSVFAVLVVLSTKGEQAGAGKRIGLLVIVVTVLVLTILQFLLASRLKSGAENVRIFERVEVIIFYTFH